MAFLETPRFPTDISYRSAGGPRYNTSIVTVANGVEYRNANWSYPRQEYDIVYGIRDYADLEVVYEFFHACRGMADGFRFKDHMDYKSCALASTIADTDQTIGTGDASETQFQLIKTYTKGANTQNRLIKKPVSGTVVVALDSVSQASGWTVDTATGIITFASPPGSNVVVSAGFEFDVGVRFNVDHLPSSHDFFEVGTFSSIPLIEVYNE